MKRVPTKAHRTVIEDALNKTLRTRREWISTESPSITEIVSKFTHIIAFDGEMVCFHLFNFFFNFSFPPNCFDYEKYVRIAIRLETLEIEKSENLSGWKSQGNTSREFRREKLNVKKVILVFFSEKNNGKRLRWTHFFHNKSTNSTFLICNVSQTNSTREFAGWIATLNIQYMNSFLTTGSQFRFQIEMEFSRLFPEQNHNFVASFPSIAPKILAIVKETKATLLTHVPDSEEGRLKILRNLLFTFLLCLHNICSFQISSRHLSYYHLSWELQISKFAERESRRKTRESQIR